MEEKNAVIQDAKIYKVFDLWKRKPKCLTFNDTDAIVVTAKIKGGENVKETFFTCLKADGTFSLQTPNHIAKLRREKLAKFLTYYKLTDSPEEYNLVDNIRKWKNKKVKVVKEKGDHYIYVP
ncbi:MAG: hypothetical protein V1672_01665 [Candidatus Diapherotrites archaeon]